MPTPSDRIRLLETQSALNAGRYVLYWMTAYRRMNWNFALQRAAEEGFRLSKPVLILDSLAPRYPGASERTHSFVLDGMLEQARTLERQPGVFYYPYVERWPGAALGLAEALAAEACLVVTDDYPDHFLPEWISDSLARLDVRSEAVDPNGVVPVWSGGRAFSSAFSFRRFVQGSLPGSLDALPEPAPVDLLSQLPKAAPSSEVVRRWPIAVEADLATQRDLASLPIEHSVHLAPISGGAAQAEDRLQKFIDSLLPRYERDRANPEFDATSGLSPYLHFGHISSQQILIALLQREGWSAQTPALAANGAKLGWWGLSEATESFLDELIVWRELSFNAAFHLADFHCYRSLPGWAQETLQQHDRDPRDELYSDEELERAATSDRVWNAAQRQLIREGRIHNYLRMVWGKNVIRWSQTPQQALGRLLSLNNKYALDGNDPNSISGIFWCFGRYDRPWPERPIFGKIRSMTSASAVRKFGLRRYLETYADA